MKKVIDGKVYNTETATKVAEWDNGIFGNDFRSCSEELYKTKKGAWFIFGKGGAMSKYSESHGNSTSGSSTIFTVTEDEAFAWLENYNEMDAIEEYFADRIEEA